jgi:hypothetical protein
VTQSIQDKHIATKRDNKKIQSNIMFTKPKGAGKLKSKGLKDAKKVFPLHNPSAISSLQPRTVVAKARQRSHPGNAAHIHWTNLKFCIYCNYGVTSKRARACMCVCVSFFTQKHAGLGRHQTRTNKKCAMRQNTGVVYVFCQKCSASTNTCTGHISGSVCPAGTAAQ